MGQGYWEKFTEEELKEIYYSSNNTEDFCKKLGYKRSSGYAIQKIKQKYEWFHSFSNIKDETGNKYGRLTVLNQDMEKNTNNGVFWICQCDCGNIVSVKGAALRNGNTKSCGCYNKEQSSKSSLIDLTGQTFGRWTVLKRAEENTANNNSKWVCQCSCNKHTIKEIDSQVLRRKQSVSCGCYTRSHGELIIEQILDNLNIKYKQQYVLPLKSINGGMLIVDFALFKNNNLSLIIEFNGAQHYRPVDIFGGEEYFKILQQNDKRKEEYSKNCNISFITFNYKELSKLDETFFIKKMLDNKIDINNYDKK